MQIVIVMLGLGGAIIFLRYALKYLRAGDVSAAALCAWTGGVSMIFGALFGLMLIASL
ncbi:MAG: hypothetical protein H7X89_07140 [Rhizobiales bacterium]|nr:hypothetical protein [Hyphomicrobiales bacterium]